MLTAKCTHSGQYRPFGDSYHVWQITATEEETIEEITEYAFQVSCFRVPEKAEWVKRLQEGYTMEEYLRGYYTLARDGENHYRFTVCRPWCD